MRLLMALLFSTMMWAQDCSPYHPVKNWETNKDVEYNLSIVSCFHAYGGAASLNWRQYSIGTHIMDRGHNGAAYLFLSYQYKVNNKIKLSTGPLYRLNNNSTLVLGQYGGDIRLYKSIWFTSRVLQINPRLNYLNVGLKVSL